MNSLHDESHILIPGPVGALEALCTQHSSSTNWMILCHPHPLHQGSMTHKILTTAARVAHRSKINTLRFNYRGVGKSEGKYGEIQGEVADAEHVLAWLMHQHRCTNLWLFGFSFGAYVACALAAKQEKLAGTILVAPSINNMPYETISSLPQPLWVVQGEDDEVIDADAVYAWVEANHLGDRLHRFPDTGHFFHGKQLMLADTLTAIISGESNGS